MMLVLMVAQGLWVLLLSHSTSSMTVRVRSVIVMCRLVGLLLPVVVVVPAGVAAVVHLMALARTCCQNSCFHCCHHHWSETVTEHL